MADTYTALLRIVQMATGSNDGTWGTKADTAFAMLEQAIAGSQSVSVAASDVTLTTANNATDQARNMALSFTGSPGVARTVTFPNVSKLTLVINASDSPIIYSAGAGIQGAAESGQVGILLTDGATNAYFFLIQDVPGHRVLAQIYSRYSL